jgi:hypothetical protein
MSEESTRRAAEEAAAAAEEAAGAAEEAAGAAMDAAIAIRTVLEVPGRSGGDGTEEGGPGPDAPDSGGSGDLPLAPTRGTDKTTACGVDEGTL